MTGQGEHVLFYIENTGIKIPEESLPHLFEPFYRVNTPETGERRKRSGAVYRENDSGAARRKLCGGEWKGRGESDGEDVRGGSLIPKW